jgi:hypothetical protein
MATIPLDFTAILKGVPEGAWVAISEKTQEVVAYAADFQTALNRAHEMGERDPLIMRVPEQSSVLFL